MPKKPQPTEPAVHPPAHKVYWSILWAILVGSWLLVAIALASYNPADWPGYAVAPHNHPGANWAGPVGSLIAHKLYLMLGPGVWITMLGWLAFMTAAALKKPVTQPALRATGIVLMSLTVSSLAATLLPYFSSRPEGAGGLVAIYIASELVKRFSTLGATLILLVLFWTAAILALDHLVLAIANHLGKACLALVQSKLPSKFPRPVLAGKYGLTPRSWLNTTLKPDSSSSPADSSPAPAIPTGTALADGEEPDPQITAELETDPDALSPDDSGVHDAPAAYLADKKPLSPDELRKKIKLLPINFAPPSKPAIQAIREIDLSGYRFPGLDLLIEPESNFTQEMELMVRDQALQLEQALQQYRIEGEVVGIDSGPVITLFEVRLAAGTKVAAIQAVASDLARALKAHNIRIVPNTVGKDTIGIEVPNHKKEKVRLKELMTISPETTGRMKLPMYLGKDASGNALIADLTEMPHMLIAGTTGSGKSVCMNSIIMSFLFTKRPDELKLVLVDPKMVELSMFKDVPHLMCPVVTEMAKAAAILDWATTKMDERYELLAEAGVRDIAGYNSLTWADLKERFQPTSEAEEAVIPKKLPYMVFIIDELADLIITNKEVEGFVVRLAQKARAVGIHLILATQRPQANVVTGLIKGNMPCRVSFKVASGLDSRIVLDQKGAELLLGQGDMLFLSPRSSKLTRAQGTLVDDFEIRKVVGFLKTIAQQNFEPQLIQLRPGADQAPTEGEEFERDPLFDDAVRIVLESKRGSVSLLQRRLNVGYSRASRLIEQMAVSGLLGDYKGTQSREVTITLDEWEAMRAQAEADAQAAQAQGTVFQKSPDSKPDSKKADWANAGDNDEDDNDDPVPNELSREYLN